MDGYTVLEYCILLTLLLIGIFISCKTGVLELKKEAKILVAVAVVISLALVAIWGVSRYKAYKIWKEHRISSLYSSQNAAFECRYYPPRYITYDEINESRLYCALHRYERYSGIHLDITRIQEYLSQEYSEDGSLMVEHIPEDIQKYIDWYYGFHGYVLRYGGDMVEDYIRDVNEYYIANQTEDVFYPYIEFTTLSEIEEIVRAYDELDEINIDVFESDIVDS